MKRTATIYEEDPLENLQVMADYIVHAHVKNVRPVMPSEPVERILESTGGSSYTGMLLDGGVVQQPLVLNALSKLGYKGALLIEHQGENDPRPALQYKLEYLRRLMDNTPSSP